MRSFATLNLLLLLALMSLLHGCRGEEEAQRQYPQRPIKLIVPFAAGGGSDTFSRILVKAIEDNQLLPEPIVIINVPGAGGTIGSRRVKNARPDGYTIMQLHEGIVTSKYSGRVNYGPEVFEPISAMGQSTMIIGVGENSPFNSLNDLMQAATDKPDSVIFSANIGAPSQFAGLMLENVTPGARFRYSQTGDGAKRFAGLQGGHTDVSSFSLAEYMQFKPSGLKAIAILGAKRNPDADEIPTAREQGFDVISVNMQFWWAPRGTPPDRIAIISEALRKAMETDEVQARLTQLNIEPLTMTGDELLAELDDRAKRAAAVSQRPTVKLPNFPAWVFGGVVVLWILSLMLSKANRLARPSTDSANEPAQDQNGHVPPWKLAISILIMTGLYVALMQWELLGYRWGTIFYLGTIGPLLTFRQPKLLGTTVALTFVLSFGLHYVFTELFVIDLP